MPSIAARIMALQEADVKTLVARYEELFGRPPRSKNKAFLWKRLAWKIQEIEYGGLPDEVRERFEKLGEQVAKEMGWDLSSPAPDKRKPRKKRRGKDRRLPAPGTVLVKDYKGEEVAVTVLDKGFEHQGKVYASLTAIAKEVTGSHWNGFLFFGLTR